MISLNDDAFARTRYNEMLQEAEEHRRIARLSAPSTVELAFAALKRALASRRRHPAAIEAQARAIPKGFAPE